MSLFDIVNAFKYPIVPYSVMNLCISLPNICVWKWWCVRCFNTHMTSEWTAKIWFYNSEMYEAGRMISLLFCVVCGHHFESSCVIFPHVWHSFKSILTVTNWTWDIMNSILVNTERCPVCNMFLQETVTHCLCDSCHTHICFQCHRNVSDICVVTVSLSSHK